MSSQKLEWSPTVIDNRTTRSIYSTPSTHKRSFSSSEDSTSILLTPSTARTSCSTTNGPLIPTLIVSLYVARDRAQEDLREFKQWKKKRQLAINSDYKLLERLISRWVSDGPRVCPDTIPGLRINSIANIPTTNGIRVLISSIRYIEPLNLGKWPHEHKTEALTAGYYAVNYQLIQRNLKKAGTEEMEEMDWEEKAGKAKVQDHEAISVGY
ncbi:hypothetical protein QBC38DRAFT_442638 [Podospora fimiseda]|uniref:Uncharacterized protein n=1 Tax=Podospora fimiseda TaxID=252190 RepID=A0AAN7BSL7_9PEZI|nr:hypothetical protein QBC38DRAFT_442638 [Podospora fimiseda]